jgi:hypothetical protein
MIPSYVTNQSKEVQKRWLEIYNSVLKSKGKEAALLSANLWLKKTLEQNKKFIKRDIITFDVDTSKGFICRADDNSEYITLVLNTTEPHKDGRVFSEELLRKWADSINNSPIVGDIDHKLFYNLMSGYNSDAKIKTILKNKPGIAKTLKAVYEDGKLWVRAIIDKRYRNLINKSKGVSAEALITEVDDSDAKVLSADLLGFSFNINTTPADYGASVI